MSNPQAKPESFLDSRTRWTMLKHLLFLEPLPGGSRWAAAFGSLLLFSFTIQVVTGVLLSFNYSPSAETAWPSVNYIQNEVAHAGIRSANTLQSILAAPADDDLISQPVKRFGESLSDAGRSARDENRVGVHFHKAFPYNPRRSH